MTLNFEAFEVFTFDCYGTIIDWESGILNTIRPLLQGHDITLPDDRILTYYAEAEAEVESGIFVPYKTVLRSVLSKFGAEFGFSPTEPELNAFQTSVHDWPPFSDSIEALRSLQRHYKLVVLSNIDDELFAHSQALLGIEFHRVFTAQQIGSYKPAMGNFEYALNALEIPRQRVLHVAQSLFHDIAPAGKLGLSTVWVNRRHDKDGSGATPIAEANPDLEVPDLKTLASIAVTSVEPNQ